MVIFYTRVVIQKKSGKTCLVIFKKKEKWERREREIRQEIKLSGKVNFDAISHVALTTVFLSCHSASSSLQKRVLYSVNIWPQYQHRETNTSKEHEQPSVWMFGSGVEYPYEPGKKSLYMFWQIPPPPTPLHAAKIQLIYRHLFHQRRSEHNIQIFPFESIEWIGDYAWLHINTLATGHRRTTHASYSLPLRLLFLRLRCPFDISDQFFDASRVQTPTATTNFSTAATSSNWGWSN